MAKNIDESISNSFEECKPMEVKEFRQKMKTVIDSSPTQSIHQLFQDEQFKKILKHETEALSKVLPSFDKKTLSGKKRRIFLNL